VSASSSMANVVEALDSRMQQEAMNKSFIAWKYKLTIYQQPFIVENFFNEINDLIKKYFSPRIIEAIYTQMCESVLYKCEKVPNEEAFEFIEDQLSIAKGFKRFQSDNLQETYPIPKHYNNMQEKDNDQKALDDIILSYISEKEANQKTDMQLNQKVLKENTGLNCEIRLSNSHIYNADNVKDPIKRRGKGRPPNKQIKGYTEKNKVDSQNQSNNDIIDNDNSGDRKC
ncbi:13930_t:CDS:2, partial [Racocetra fulgida]